MRPLASDYPLSKVVQGDKEREVIIGALPGSAGTLMLQWLGALGFAPVSTHGHIGMRGDFRISMHRDPRDSICSLARRKFYNEYTEDRENGLLLACDDFIANRWVDDAVRNQLTAHLVIRFEDYFYDFTDELLDDLLYKLDLVVPDWFFGYLLWEFSLERNRLRASRLKDFGEVDWLTRIHGRHITSGQIGVWGELFTPRVTEKVKELEIERLGYE